MNLREIEIFRAVMETGSVTEAARRLGVSQPAVSKMLRHFESDLGFQAFTRERKRLHATSEATALYNEVERAFVSLDYLQRFARDLRGLRQGHLVIGATYAASTGWLPGVISEFLNEFPGLSVSLQVMQSPRVAQAVATGHADLGIVQFALTGQSVHQERLLSVDAVCVLPPGHRLSGRKFLRPEDFRNERFVALAPVDRYRARLDALLQRRGVTRRIQIDTPLASAVCAFVMQGMGIAVIDRLSALDNSYRGIAIRPLRPRIAEDLILVTPARHGLSRIADAFAGHLRDHCASALRGDAQPG
jgi:DNA-binding transcriptional LysR family regulator